MSYFKTALIAKDVMGGWILVQELIYHSSFLDKDIKVPRGFYTDLASVPRVFHFIVPVATGKNRRAAVVHDYLCIHGEKKLGISQSQADWIFKEALEVCGVGVIGRYGLYFPTRAYQAIKGIFS